MRDSRLDFTNETISSFAEDYLDRLEISFGRTPPGQRSKVNQSLFVALQELPADFLLEDFPAIAVAYHGILSFHNSIVQVQSEFLISHESMLAHLGLLDEGVQQQFLQVIYAIQQDSALPRLAQAPEEPIDSEDHSGDPRSSVDDDGSSPVDPAFVACFDPAEELDER